MGMTGPLAAADFGTATNQRQLAIVTPSHPLAAGLTGRVTVTASLATFSWGRPAPSAVVIARLPDGSTRAGIFAYEKGAAMVGHTAPGRRVGFFLDNTTPSSLTPAGGPCSTPP